LALSLVRSTHAVAPVAAVHRLAPAEHSVLQPLAVHTGMPPWTVAHT